jgi:hypothetical protein
MKRLDRTVISFEGIPFTWRELLQWVVVPVAWLYISAILLIAIAGR